MSDREIERKVLDFHQGDQGPYVRHLIERHTDESLGERTATTDPHLPSGSVSLPDHPSDAAEPLGRTIPGQ